VGSTGSLVSFGWPEENALFADQTRAVQFHTGHGDNDLLLSLATPSLLQPLVRAYPDTPVVLLHTSYPVRPSPSSHMILFCLTKTATGAAHTRGGLPRVRVQERLPRLWRGVPVREQARAEEGGRAGARAVPHHQGAEAQYVRPL
jgi:hypothetical protein